jgi:hypothetical protein
MPMLDLIDHRGELPVQSLVQPDAEDLTDAVRHQLPAVLGFVLSNSGSVSVSSRLHQYPPGVGPFSFPVVAQPL